MSGETKVTPGHVFNEEDGEQVDLEKLNRIVRDMVVKVLAGSIGTSELANKSVTADKLDADISAQLGLADGAVTLAKLSTNFVLPVAKGGTGATDAAAARANLGLDVQSLGTAYALNTEYTNESDRPVMVVCWVKSNTSYGSEGNDVDVIGAIGASAATTTVARQRVVGDLAYRTECTITFLVPAGWKYKVKDGTGYYNCELGRFEVWEI